MGAVASEASKQLAHAVSFGVTLAIVSNVAQMVYWKSLTRQGTYWNRNGPTLLAAAAIPLVMLDLTRHVLQVGRQPHSLTFRAGEHIATNSIPCR